MFDSLVTMLTLRTEAFRLLFEPRRTAIGLPNRELEALLRQRREERDAGEPLSQGSGC